MNDITNSYRLIICSDSSGQVQSDLGISVYAKAISKINLHTVDIFSIVSFHPKEKTTEFGLSITSLQRALNTGCTIVVTDKGLSQVTSTFSEMRFEASKSIRRSLTIENDSFSTGVQILSAKGPLAALTLSFQLIQKYEGTNTLKEVLRLLCASNTYINNKYQIVSTYFDLTPQERKWEELEHWIQRNITSKLTVEVLADHMAMSSRTFTRHCKDRFKMSPKKLVEKIRLEMALDMVVNTQLALGSIAVSCGYLRAENMQRSFVRELGNPPNEYRRRNVA
ncbi:helix-turn-helix domain-containing protein [Vibrio sinaloensis]|uniref:helix-turn-helix domain-containing protein n=1 Tax=Photobacterium sp. (strain ATCC 43367) TaxID=379097 RepID=UPI00204D3002|nr:helix-turn-helix domain-containing protein [Vibrio sinaloensis]UPQ89148.1 helix-turn-helix domain-containing protein [Vibrio sinaloensis]